jgi:hypothetical protein
MTRKCLFINIWVLTLTFFCVCQAQTYNDSAIQNMFKDIQQSHIEANIPDKNHFDSILNRDLEKYFSTIYGQITVKWEFLREGPTQAGVSYPKYYLWTKINKEEKLISEGAVRVEAIEKTRFKITDYIDISEINNKSKDIYTVFPRPVCERIKSKLK